MSTTTITNDSVDTSGEVIHDKQALNLKHQMMNKMQFNSLLNSVSRMATFAAGVMLSAGMAIIAPLLKGVGSIGDLMTAVGGSEIGIAFMAIAGLATVVAVGTDYAASRIWQSGNFDNFEINAESTARHLVQELKTSRTTLVSEHAMNQRADGKKWVQVVSKDPQAIAQQS